MLGELYYTHAIKYYSAFRRNDTLIHATTQKKFCCIDYPLSHKAAIFRSLLSSQKMAPAGCAAWGGSGDCHLSIQSSLPISHMEFCPNCTWPWGLGEWVEYIGEEGVGEGAPATALGTSPSISGGCPKVAHTTVHNPTPTLCI